MFSENTGTAYILNTAKIWQAIVGETILQLKKVFFLQRVLVLLMAFDSQTLWAERTGETGYQTFVAAFFFLFSKLTPSPTLFLLLRK